MNLQQHEKLLDMIISAAYDKNDTEHIATNQFETKPNCKLYDDFVDKYLPKDFVNNDAWCDLIDLIVEERKTAFAVGFRSALKMCLTE